MSRLAQRLEDDGIRPTATIVRGVPLRQILARVEQVPGAMVVMSTKGASGFSRWLRGSVADGVIRLASAPTVVVPPVDALRGPSMD